jgi:hypothetical protein
MAFDIEGARANGYTDEEIQTYLNQREQPVAATTPTDRSEEYTGLAQGLGMEAAKYLGYGLGGAYALKKGADLLRSAGSAGAAGSAPSGTATAGSILSETLGRPGTVPTGTMGGPVAPSAVATATPPPTVQQVTQSPALREMARRLAQPSLVDRAADIATRMREVAANRVVQGAMRAGTGIAALAMPSNVGQNYPYPTTGYMAGQEINPYTQRPWTPQELEQYNRGQYRGQ